MTINEYRAKHKRCRTCEYAQEDSYSWKCLAKGHLHSEKLGCAGIKGCFCRLYKPAKEVEDEQREITDKR